MARTNSVALLQTSSLPPVASSASVSSLVPIGPSRSFSTKTVLLLLSLLEYGEHTQEGREARPQSETSPLWIIPFSGSLSFPGFGLVFGAPFTTRTYGSCGLPLHPQICPSLGEIEIRSPESAYIRPQVSLAQVDGTTGSISTKDRRRLAVGVWGGFSECRC